ncbi:helix-turn-helix domain-containing protein [Marisediminicola sp. LYQ85]|uniref:helix-turn-helix domain-containing protein n=1 Tax=Marisediminicola sp. LYQ85 TaxID=3391062 RepID=UPI0039832255
MSGVVKFFPKAHGSSEVKSGSSSAIAFGRVLYAARKRAIENQADVAASFDPKLSVAAVSMAEKGDRPPKTDVIVRGYARALDLDEDDLVELWWAMQGMVEVEDLDGERTVRRWWRQLWASPQVELDHMQADGNAKVAWTPNDEVYAPPLHLFALSDAICVILRRLLGGSWNVRQYPELGLLDPIGGRLAVVMIELSTGEPAEGAWSGVSELTVKLVCPEPVARPVLLDAAARSKSETVPADVAWILSAVEAMPARERAAVAGFIRGLQEGASLFSEPSY